MSVVINNDNNVNDTNTLLKELVRFFYTEFQIQDSSKLSKVFKITNYNVVSDGNAFYVGDVRTQDVFVYTSIQEVLKVLEQ